MELKSVSNLVKKESLLFKKKVKTQHANFCEKINDVVNLSSCFVLTPEMAQAIYFKAKYQGIESKIHKDYNKKEIRSFASQKQIEFVLKRQESKAIYFIVLPTDWMLSGGLIVSQVDLFSNFWNLSCVMEDDFMVLDKSLSNSILCSGDRINDKITDYNITVKGSDFEVVCIN